MPNQASFRRGSNKLVKCRSCGKLTHSTIDGCLGLDLCRPCRLDAEQENAHLDYHDGAPANERDPEHCRFCREEDAAVQGGVA